MSLPEPDRMYSPVPSKADVHHDSDESASTCTAETLSMDSLMNIVNLEDEEQKSTA